MKHFQRIAKILRPHAIPLILLLLLPILANAIALSGLFITDPTLLFIGLATDIRPGWIHGPMGWLDPTIAYIVQPQGYLAVSDWLHGIVPWWNPYSGAGMPLAAEMQTLAFFLPFVFLLHFSLGWLFLRILLQAMCGVFAYALFIELGLARAAALLGGALYALSPIFFLSPHASMAPLPFLPLLLLGIEHAATAARARAPGGCSLIIIALAYSVYAGFPEVTYFDGLLAGLWTLWRAAALPRGLWSRFAGKIMFGLLIGLALCAPLLIPFLEYLPLAFVGAHAGNGFAYTHLTPALVPLQIMPYLYGLFDIVPRPPLDAAFNHDGSFVRMPGWAGLPVLALTFAAIARRRTALRWVLCFWVAVWEARYLGIAPVTAALNLIPGIATCDSARFSGPAVNFAIYVLAAFAFDDYQRLGAMRKPRLAAILAVLAILVAASVLPIRRYISAVYASSPNEMVFALTGACFAAATLALLCVELRQPRHHRLLAGLLIAGPLAGFAFPQLAGVRAGRTDMAPISWLQHHIGTSRMMSLGPFDAAFPARYRVASIDYAGMPVPALWVSYVGANLFANGDLNIYRGGAFGEQGKLMAAMPQYEALGLRYVVTNPGAPLIPAATYAPLDPATRNYPQTLLPGGLDLTGIFAASPPFRTVTGLSVLVGTFGVTASGPIFATLCAANICTTGTADAATAADNGPLTFFFKTPLSVPPNSGFAYRFSHPSGKPVAIWLVPDGFGHENPSITFISVATRPMPQRVFQDDTAAIYELPNPAPYAQTANAGCKLTILERQKMLTSCPSATTLLRREMFYPGWSARVNGAPVPVSQAGLFQSVPVPAGAAYIRFSYAPPHIRLACGIALMALLIWIGSGSFLKKRTKKLLLLGGFFKSPCKNQ
jgi:hypothetical protein